MVRPVGIGDARAALEGNAVILRRTEAAEVVQIRNLLGRQIEYRVGVHGDEIEAMRAGAFDARAGDKMAVARQSVRCKQFASAIDHPLIEHVDVLEIDPRADAVVAEVPALVFEGLDQLAENGAGLGRGGAGRLMIVGAKPGAPEMAVPIFLDDQMPRGKAYPEQRAAAIDMIGEQGELRPSQRRLLHDRDGDLLARFISERAVAHGGRLVEYVAQEDAAEDGSLGRQTEGAARRRITLADEVNLPAKVQARRHHDGDEVLRSALRAVEASRRKAPLGLGHPPILGFETAHEWVSARPWQSVDRERQAGRGRAMSAGHN